jgi:hypothetical protein
MAALLAPMLLAVACTSSSGVSRSAQELGQRLQVGLAPDVAAGRAALEPLPDGARVTLSDVALFPTGATELDDKGRYVLASVIQGLLSPRILLIEITESPASPVGLQGLKARAVTQYLEEYGLQSTLQPPVPPDSAGAVPRGLTITVSIVSS